MWTTNSAPLYLRHWFFPRWKPWGSARTPWHQLDPIVCIPELWFMCVCQNCGSCVYPRTLFHMWMPEHWFICVFQNFGPYVYDRTLVHMCMPEHWVMCLCQNFDSCEYAYFDSFFSLIYTGCHDSGIFGLLFTIFNYRDIFNMRSVLTIAPDWSCLSEKAIRPIHYPMIMDNLGFFFKRIASLYTLFNMFFNFMFHCISFRFFNC